jgi:hypothetical protein
MLQFADAVEQRDLICCWIRHNTPPPPPPYITEQCRLNKLNLLIYEANKRQQTNEYLALCSPKLD